MFNLGLGNSAPTVGLSALREATRRVNTSFERLATGKRINRASDDPSGMVAVESLKAQEIDLREKIKSNELQQQWTGARDGALSVLGDLFIDLEGLVQQGANSAGLSTQEKRGIQDQIDSILNTVDYLSNTVTFKGGQLMQGRNRTSFGIAELASGGKLNILSGNLEDAQKAATAAREAVTSERAAAGARAQGLDHEQNALMKQLEELTGARSKIEDTDFAAEASEFVRAQAQQQVALFTRMMAEKQKASTVLQLLGMAAA